MTPAPTPRELYSIDAVFEETGSPADERLAAYTIAVRIIPGYDAIPGKLRFVEPYASVPSQSVFGEVPLLVAGSADGILVTATGEIDGAVDINSGDGAVRLHFTLDRSELPDLFVYSLAFDPDLTCFSDADGNPIAITFDNGVVTVIPEPASISILSVLAALVSARRRGR